MNTLLCNYIISVNIHVLTSMLMISTLCMLQMTALDGNLGGPGTLGGTLAATLGTLTGGTLGGGNTKKMSKAFGNAWRGAAAYHFYMLSLKQFYDGKAQFFVLQSV